MPLLGMLSASLHIKLITNTYYSLYVSWVFAVWLNLFPQVIYYIYYARLAAIAIHVPDSFKNLLL